MTSASDKPDTDAASVSSRRSIGVDSKIDAFHLHLDDCDWCRDHPFELCMAGHRLLVIAGKLTQ